MARIGNLEVRIGADTSSFEAGIRTAADRLNDLEGATERAGRKISAFGDKLVGVGGKLSTYVSAPMAAAAGAAFAFASRFAAGADQTVKHADKIGVASDALQELRFAAERAGVQSSTLDTGLQRLARRTAEAATGGGALKKVLEDYGISATDAAGNTRAAEDMLGEIAGAMQRAGSEGEQLRIAIAAFDTEGAGMVNMLRDGSAGLEDMRQKARDLGAVIGEDTLRASEQFQDNMLDLKTQISAAGNAIGVALIPAFNELIPLVVEKVIPGVQALAGGVADVIQWFTALPAPVQEAAGVVALALGAAGPAVMAVGVFAKVLGGLVAAAGPVGLAIAAATLLFVAWQTWGDDITALVQHVVGWLGETFTGFAAGAVQIWTDMGNSIVEAIRAPFARISELTEMVTQSFLGSWLGVKDEMVDNSIIPDMMTEMEAQFGRLWGMADVNAAVAGDITKTWQKSSADQTKAIQQGATQALGLLGQFFEGSKAIGIAQAIANTWIGVSETLAKYPWPIAGVLAGIHAAAGLANVANLRGTTKDGGGGGRGRGRRGGVAAMPAMAPEAAPAQVTRIEGIRPGDLFTGEQLIELIGDAQRRGSVLELGR